MTADTLAIPAPSRRREPRHDGIEQAREDAAQAVAGLHAHELLCAERYSQLLSRVGRLEAIVIASAGAVIVGMFGLLTTMLLMRWR